MSFYIKDIEIKNKVILAPMAGVTSFSYRKFMNKFGPGLTYTEMISDMGLIYGNHTTIDMLKTDGSDRPLALQLFGGTKETLLKAIDKLDGLNIEYDILDLNLACPVPKVTKSNGGSTWLKDQDLLFDMVSAVVKRSKKPVSAKIRLGFDEVNVYETAKTLEKAGVSFIAVHARTKKDLYSGEPRFEEIKNLRDIIKIPFAVSGNIYTPEDALNALKITRADAVLVARGGEGNPKLITYLLKALNNEEYKEEYFFDEQTNYLKEFAMLLKEEKGEKIATAILRGLAPKFFNHIKSPYIKELKVLITATIRNFDDIFEIIKDFREKHPEIE